MSRSPPRADVQHRLGRARRERPAGHASSSPATPTPHGYHRGLDQLRRNGWKGFAVPWAHVPNQGFLRRSARCTKPPSPSGRRTRPAARPFLADADPAAPAALGILNDRGVRWAVRVVLRSTAATPRPGSPRTVLRRGRRVRGEIYPRAPARWTGGCLTRLRGGPRAPVGLCRYHAQQLFMRGCGTPSSSGVNASPPSCTAVRRRSHGRRRPGRHGAVRPSGRGPCGSPARRVRPCRRDDDLPAPRSTSVSVAVTSPRSRAWPRRPSAPPTSSRSTEVEGGDAVEGRQRRVARHPPCPRRRRTPPRHVGHLPSNAHGAGAAPARRRGRRPCLRRPACAR